MYGNDWLGNIPAHYILHGYSWLGKLRTAKNWHGLLHCSHHDDEGIHVYRLKVKEVAAAKGLSQRQLFFRSGVDLKTIQNIFREPTITNVTIETLDRLAVVLDVDVSDLVESIRQTPKTPLP
jgi:DNA-binding Xre family transcriptional regulator